MPIEAPMTMVWLPMPIRRAERGDQAIGDRLQMRLVGPARGDDREFVAADARDDIVAAQRMGQALRSRCG